jgi:hypothetical protein
MLRRLPVLDSPPARRIDCPSASATARLIGTGRSKPSRLAATRRAGAALPAGVGEDVDGALVADPRDGDAAAVGCPGTVGLRVGELEQADGTTIKRARSRCLPPACAGIDAA